MICDRCDGECTEGGCVCQLNVYEISLDRVSDLGDILINPSDVLSIGDNSITFRHNGLWSDLFRFVNNGESIELALDVVIESPD